jgi:hypothetical protein
MANTSRPDYGLPNLSTIANLSYWDATLHHNLIYAMRHGYRFRRTVIDPIEGLYRTWSKIPAIIEAMNDCAWIVFLDSDACESV